jgi:hypothetical protein
MMALAALPRNVGGADRVIARPDDPTLMVCHLWARLR